MKKKLSTLIGLLALVVGLAYAAGETEIFSASFNTKPATQSTPDYFTLGEKQNWNAKYTGTYRGVSYSQGLKMESATTVSFTAAKSFKVTIVQSLTANPTKYMKLNDTQFTEADRVDDAANNVGVYTVSNLPAGDYVLTRGNGENGLLFIEVEYLDDSKAPSDLAAVNASKDLPIFGGAYTMTKGVDFTTSSTGAITFESTNSAVATVDADGVVTPVAEGTTNIVISQAADDNYNGGSATITVNVTDSRTVNDITLEISAATLEIGNTVSVAATSSSTGAITYATSDANIATVDEAGLVTAVGGGTATITVKQEGTDDYKPGETTATIKVLFPDIVLDGNQFILKEGDAGDGRKVIGKDITMTFADGQGKWNVDATKQNYADPTYNYWCAGTQNGNKFSFAPYAKGTLTVAIGLGANKTFHFQKNGTEMTVGTDYTYNLPAAAGEESQVLDGTVPVQVYGTVTAEVEEGAVYTVYCDGSKIGFMGFNFDAQAVPKTLVYPFAEIEGFDAWGSSYTQHVVNYTADGVTVTFESADKDSSTIKDIPVTKGKSVTVEAANEILSVRLVCRQWTTKEQTINVAAGPDKDNLTPLDTQSSNFVLEAPIGNGAKAVQFTFGNTNQIGIDSLYLTLAAGAAPLSVAISPVAGDYYSAQEVTLTPSKALADVFYSFDGENFSRYSEPVNVEEDATIYAKAQLGSEVSEVVTASYRIAKVYESFEELIDVPAEGQPVVVSFNSLTIDSIYTTSKGARNGVYVTVNGKVAEIYAYDVPEEWEAGGRITGTTQGVWKEYNGVKEVCPASWEGITYKGADVNVDKLWNFAEFTDADTVGVDATGTWGGTYDTSKKTSSYKSQAAFEGPVMANATTPFAKMEGLTFKTTAAEALQYRFYTLESVGGYHVYIYDAVEMTVPTDKDKVVRFVAKSYSGEITMGVTGANTSSVAIAYASASNYATYEVVATGDYVTFTLPKNMQIQSIEVCDATPTGISEVKNCIFNDASIYNLRGQKVTNIKAGEVYIVNGKKYLAK